MPEKITIRRAHGSEQGRTIIYTDGGARGNPGPAAIGAWVQETSDKRQEVKEYSKFLGTKTNNEAEYEAIIFGLKKVKQLIGKKKAEKAKIEIRSDSELIVSQLNGNFKIKEKDLISYFIEIWNLKQDFKKVEYVQIPREENKRADRLVNRELDSQRGLF